MKNLYRKGKVHPSSPPPPPTTTISDRLALLPATIMTLTVALSPQDREVLAYLISSSCNNNTSTNFSGHRNNLTQKITTTTTNGGGGGGEHGIKFDCDCFRCYMSYWVRWDTSPNRQLIHEIIDAYEEGLFDDQKKNMKKNKKQRKRRVFDNSFKENSALITDESLSELESAEVLSCGGCGGGGGGGEVVGLEKGSSVTKLVSYIGEKIWGAWSKL